MTILFNKMRRVMTLGLLTASIVTLAACSSSSSNGDGDGDGAGPTMNADGTTNFIVPLGPEQEVPPVEAAGASGEGTLDIDTTGGAITGSVSVTGLSDTATMAHIHAAFAGTNGAFFIVLEPNEDMSVWSVPADTTLTAEQLLALNSGGLYINVHTAANPGGEVRGQIIPADVTVRRTTLSGDNEVPPVTTDATGTGVATVNVVTGAIDAVVSVSGFADDNLPTMAHIHDGPADENGGVIIPLDPDPNDASRWVTPASSILTGAQVIDLEANGLYFNVHTPTNDGGEIRGQL